MVENILAVAFGVFIAGCGIIFLLKKLKKKDENN